MKDLNPSSERAHQKAKPVDTFEVYKKGSNHPRYPVASAGEPNPDHQ
jgi:hypothetical protein